MREIKFRAWDKKKNFMITQDDKQLKSLDLASGYIYVGHYKGENDRFIRFAEIELMQYTVLKDRQGREIYEGDVFQYTIEHDTFSHENGHTTFETKHQAVVEFSLGTFMLGDEFLGDALEYDDSLRYLGNIYENPELLEIEK